MYSRLLLPCVLIITLVFPGASAFATVTGSACQTLQYFFKPGCPHCERADVYLRALEEKQSDIRIQRYNVQDRINVWPQYVELINRFSIEHPGVPFIVICENYVVGYDSPDTTGKRIEDYLGLTQTAQTPEQKTLYLPLLGEIDADEYGLPLLTVVIGLIDGFNPCAMWVLLFLLSLLLSLKQRSRIIIIAGTFVLISGLVYFAFMAAWLNVFLIIGFSRLLQILVAIVALLIGFIHIKDYFAFKKGVSLSIPDASKPGLYARMRQVIYAENLWASLLAVSVLAVLVNLIELLCTAGLPAIYTHILTSKALPEVNYYAYLALYNLAYIFDDALMVSIVVLTLSRTKIQETTGRLLKLISGSVIVILGIALLLFPEWLV